MATVPHSPVYSASDLLRRSSYGFNGIQLQTLGRARFGLQKRNFGVAARLRKGKRHEHPWPDNPDPNVKGGILTHLSHFKPLKEKPKPVTLNFEKPLLDLEKKIDDVRKMAEETNLDFSEQIASLERKYHRALVRMYTNLAPIQRVYIARHPNRPTFLDHVFSITEKFVELHGDRGGYDDPAIVTGLGTIDGKRYMFIGQQKGRNTKENVKRNFGMPTPHGYRKALRMMHYADQHGFPIITFVDTPGAFADLKSEHLGQGEAIAHNLEIMFGLKVPIISIIIGEGGSGGALAIACANKLLMLENAVLYVASPEACAAILWKSSKAIPEAAKRLKITAHELCKMKIADGIIREPLGGAHTDPSLTSQRIKNAINEAMAELEKMDTPELLRHRSLKFRCMGRFQDGKPMDPEKIFKMEKIKTLPVTGLEKDVEKLRQHITRAKESSRKPSVVALNKMINRLKRETFIDYSVAVEALGLKDRFSSLQGQISKASPQGQPVHPVLMENMKKLKDGVNARLPAAPNYSKLKYKLDLLKEFSLVKSSLEKNSKVKWSNAKIKEKIKQVLNQPDMKEKMEIFGAEVRKLRSTADGGLDEGKKENIAKMKKEINLEIADRLKSVGLNVRLASPRARELIKRTLTLQFKAMTGIFREKINKKIENMTKSPKMRRMINLLKSEVEKARKTPTKIRIKRIKALQQLVNRRLSGAISSVLKKKDKKLIAELILPTEYNGGLNGSLKNDDSQEEGAKHEESRVKINLGSQHSFV